MFRETVELKSLAGKVEKLDEDFTMKFQEGVFNSLEDEEATTFKEQIFALKNELYTLMGNITVNPKLNKVLYKEYLKILKSFENLLKKNDIIRDVSNANSNKKDK